MSGKWSKVTGDIGDHIDATLGGIQDLATVTAIEAHVWRLHVAPVTLACTITSTVARTVRIDLGLAGGWLATQTAGGAWYIEVQCTFADGTVLTFPDRASDVPQLATRAQGA